MIEYDINSVQPIEGEIAPVSEFAAEISVGGVIRIQPEDIYDGEYEFTPSSETQIAPTADTYLARNIIINPIPNNYGLITYDGFGITVS